MFLNIENPVKPAGINFVEHGMMQGMWCTVSPELKALRKKIASSGRRILVVDDNPINRKLMRILLEKNGQEVIQACNGQEAVALVREIPFDAVLMDLQMPVMSGFEATSLIRQAEIAKGTRVPIIAITAFSSPEYQESRCLASGMDAYLTKPLGEFAFWKTLLQVTSDDLNS